MVAKLRSTSKGRASELSADEIKKEEDAAVALQAEVAASKPKKKKGTKKT